MFSARKAAGSGFNRVRFSSPSVGPSSHENVPGLSLGVKCIEERNWPPFGRISSQCDGTPRFLIIITAAKSTGDYSLQSKRNSLTVSFFSSFPGK